LVMIKLGLERAFLLTKPIPQVWPAIHVAGTNGKGSICAFITNALKAHGLKCGTFTSPHLIDRWDCIKINGEPVKQSLFNHVQQKLRERDQKEVIQATEFELLTATAFDIFNEEKVEVGIVEVGMGGRRDATNVLKHKALTVISRIGLDHQDFLGNTLEDITAEKCGIFAEGVPVIYDSTNDPEVLKEIRRQSFRMLTRTIHDQQFDYFRQVGSPQPDLVFPLFKEAFGRAHFQRRNAMIAYNSAYTFLASQGISPTRDTLAHAIINTKVPGRMQMVDLEPIVGRHVEALLDGAHNPQAIEQFKLAIHTTILRDGPVSWVFAFSDGKPLEQMISPLIRSGDSVAAVEFGSVDGMPWKQAMPSRIITEYMRKLPNNLKIEFQDFGSDIRNALVWSASQERMTKSIVIVGSLYLVSDVLRMYPNISLSSKGPRNIPSLQRYHCNTGPE